jgi:hypothetical protein
MSILSSIFSPEGVAEPSENGAPQPADMEAAQVAPPPDPVLPTEETAEGTIIGPSPEPVPADDFSL